MCKSESWSVSGHAAREPLGQWGTHAAALTLLPGGRKLRSPPAELGSPFGQPPHTQRPPITYHRYTAGLRALAEREGTPLF